MMPPERAAKTVRLRIEGEVQRVWFRAWTVETVEELGLDGWVRNRADGSVEVLVSGPAEGVEKMIKACWQGPSSARVTAVRTTGAKPPGEKGFHQRPTV